MRLRIFAVTSALVLSLSAVPAFASESSNVQVSPNKPTSGDLVNEPKKWDGKQVTFTGEVITEAQERGDFSWIHINDDAYYLKNVEEGAGLGGYNSGHAVWIPTELTKKITYYGDYTHEGDVVTIKGTFNAACGQHGGDMDIHATSLVVDIPGHSVHEPVKVPKLVIAVFMLALAALLWEANRRVTHRETFGALAGRIGRSRAKA